jgi:hypothetical protein
MEPKFQSSFIPKGPVAATTAVPKVHSRDKSFLSFIASIVFFLSLLSLLGVFGYRFYLVRSINKMGQDLEAAQAALASEPIDEFIRLDGRIRGLTQLVSSHVILSPLLDYLETSTVKSVRFTEFNYSILSTGRIEVTMKGQASGYAGVALQSDIFEKGKYFEEMSFSDLSLNERGDVVFAFRALLDPTLVSYQKSLEHSVVAPPISAPIQQPVVATTSTPSTASTSSGQAPTSAKTSTTTTTGQASTSSKTTPR